MYIAGRYASLVPSAKLRNRFYSQCKTEFDDTAQAILAITGHKKLLETQPQLAASIKLRNAYIDPLHYLQIHFLKSWRDAPIHKRTEAQRRLMALTVNGIAFGMKSTG